MARKLVPRGTGITQVFDLHIDGDDLEDPDVAFQRIKEERERQVREAGGAFAADTLHIVKYCEELLSDETTSMAHDSPREFAARIVSAYRLAQIYISEGNADAAANAALTMGWICSQFEMKRNWEPDALRGKKSREASRRGGVEPGATLPRDVEMAREFLSLRLTARASRTAIMERIGAKRDLGRSASIEAIKRGLQKLSGEPAKPDSD